MTVGTVVVAKTDEDFFTEDEPNELDEVVELVDVEDEVESLDDEVEEEVVEGVTLETEDCIVEVCTALVGGLLVEEGMLG